MKKYKCDMGAERKNMIKKSKDHLETVQEGYIAHMRFALVIAGMTAWATIALIIHAFLPAYHQTTGSKIITKIYRVIEERQHAHPHHHDKN
ncbi:MAG: DUF6356 family protein [Alphaproteobacteria bacterium]